MSLQFYELGEREDVCKYDHIVSRVKSGRNMPQESLDVWVPWRVCGVQIVTRAWMTTQWMLLQCVDDYVRELLQRVDDHVMELLQRVDEHAREVITVCHTKRARTFFAVCS